MHNWFNGAMGPVPAYAAAGYDRAAPKQEKQHHWQLMSSSASGRYASGGSGRSAQTPKQGITRRAIIALVLLVLLPPVGILMLWYKGIFQLRGRVLLTAIGIVILTAMFTLAMPSATVVEVQPSAVKAGLRTPLPTDAALNALSNMDELLAGVENVPITTTEETAAADETAAEDAAAQQATDEPYDVMQEVVYSVRSGAKYYHTSGECNGQVNRRSLTVQQVRSALAVIFYLQSVDKPEVCQRIGLSENIRQFFLRLRVNILCGCELHANRPTIVTIRPLNRHYRMI